MADLFPNVFLEVHYMNRKALKIMIAVLMIASVALWVVPYAIAGCDPCMFTVSTAYSGEKQDCKTKVKCSLAGVDPNDQWGGDCEASSSCLLTYDLTPQHRECKSEGTNTNCDPDGQGHVTQTTKTSDGCWQFLIFQGCEEVTTTTHDVDDASGINC